MPMTTAETARTLAVGRLTGVLRVPGRPGTLPVVHATDAAGAEPV